MKSRLRSAREIKTTTFNYQINKGNNKVNKNEKRVESLFGKMEIREEFYRRVFGPWGQMLNSTDNKAVHIDIYPIPPNLTRNIWTIITGGMSDKRQKIPSYGKGIISPRTEIMMYAREPKEWMYAALKHLAEFPFDKNTYLNEFHTVTHGPSVTTEPSELTAYFLVPPVAEDDCIEKLYIDGDKVDILLLAPITERERQYAVDNGGQKLYDLFVANKVSVIFDENRKSIV